MRFHKFTPRNKSLRYRNQNEVTEALGKCMKMAVKVNNLTLKILVLEVKTPLIHSQRNSLKLKIHLCYK